MAAGIMEWEAIVKAAELVTRSLKIQCIRWLASRGDLNKVKIDRMT